MARETSVHVNHLRGLLSVAVALQTGKPFHTHTVDDLILVTARTCLFIRSKCVAAAGVAIAAAYVLHEHMPGMAVRIAKSYGTLRDLRKMAVFAGIPGGDSAMGLLRGCPGPFYDIGNEHLVLFEHAYLMTSLAGEIPVFAQLPCFKRFLHHMALSAEIGVFFGISVIPEADDSTQNRKKKEEQHDRLLVFFDETQAE